MILIPLNIDWSYRAGRCSVGRQTINGLNDRGYEVHAVGNTVTDGRARWYRADLLDQQARRHLVAAVRPDAVLRMASTIGDRAPRAVGDVAHVR